MNNTIEILVNEIFNLLKNKNINQIINIETDNIYNKSGIPLLIKRHLETHSNFCLKTLKDNNVILKFISVDSNYKCFEAMSFAPTSLCNILFEEWDCIDNNEISTFKNQLSNYYIFIPIIKEKVKGSFNHYLEWEIGELSFWRPTKSEIKLIGEEWNQIKNRIKDGVKLKNVKYGNSFRTENNLHKQSETNYIHLRPHGKNSFDFDKMYLEFTKGKVQITKQSFWLNKEYINSILKINKWKLN